MAFLSEVGAGSREENASIERALFAWGTH